MRKCLSVLLWWLWIYSDPSTTTPEGGIARTAMHALMGGAVSSATGGDFKSGAIAAGASQALAGALNATFDAQPELRQAFSQIVGLTAAGLAGGDVEKASWVALMADEYNRQLHQKETVALEGLQKESPEKAYELKAAACALVHCAASVPVDDRDYKAIKTLETDGKGFKDAQSALFATGAFDEYSKWDQVNDDLLLNDKDLKQSARASRAVLGAIGAAAGFGGAILTTPACVTGLGCAIPAFSGLGGAASFVDGWQATGQLFAPYDYTQGSKVLASFDSATYPGDVNPLRDYGTEAAKAALEIALLKGAGKYLEGTGASVLVSGVKKDSAVVVDGAKAPGDTVVRRDNEFSSPVGGNGKPKAYINENGDLVPPNSEGTGSVQTHVRGSAPENSPYISVTDPSTTSNPKDYGTNQIEIDVKRLQQDIDSGVLPNTKFLTSQQVAAELQSKLDTARVRYENNPSKRNEDSLKGAERDLGNAMRDGECLIKGCVPSTYINPVGK